MKIVFFGTPDYVLPIVSEVHKKFSSKNGESGIVAVVTQKPKPTGRKQFITYSAVDTWAYKRKIPVLYDSGELIKQRIEADLGILAAYGEIIPKSVIDHLKFGILNVHPSLLPSFRGASPVQAAIVSGLSQTGVTIIKLDEKLDHGPIVSQFTEEIFENDTTETLRNRLFERSGEVVAALIPAYVANKIKLKEQNHKEATFTTQITKEDGFIPPEFLKLAMLGSDPTSGPTSSKVRPKSTWRVPFIKNYSLVPSACSLGCFIRAMHPWPGAWTYIRLTADSKQSKRLKIIKAHLEKLVPSAYRLVPDLVQLEGKTEVSYEEFKKGYPNSSFNS